MTKFNLKKQEIRKKIYFEKDNILSKIGNDLINSKLDFINKRFGNCLMLDDEIEIKNKKVNHYERHNLLNNMEHKNKYDGIFSNFGAQLPFEDDIDTSLISIYSKLKNNGLFCFNLLGKDTMATLSKIFIEIDESIFNGAHLRFGPYHDISNIIENLNKYKFKEIVVSTDSIELNYKSFYKLRDDLKKFGLSNYYLNKPKYKKEFYIKVDSIFSKIIEKYNYIPVELEIATFTSWK